MDALQELRIKAEMARSLGHDAVAQGLEEAMKTLGVQPQAEMALSAAPPPPPPPPEPANARRKWLPADDEDLRLAWAEDEPVEKIAERQKRTPGSIYTRAMHRMKLPARDIDRPTTRFVKQGN